MSDRVHNSASHYCEKKESDTGKHGTHFIIYRGTAASCERCEEKGIDPSLTERCPSYCNDCSKCEPCEKGFTLEKNGQVAKPTLEEYKSAIPYTADILDIFKT